MDQANESKSNRQHLRITPWEAFAGAAAVVSALGLAFSLGRQVPTKPAMPREETHTFESVYNQPPTTYQQLQVDRGEAR